MCYDVTAASGIDRWVKNWGNLPAGQEVATGVRGGSDGETIVEIAAEYVLAWQVAPKFWDGTQVVSDDPENPAYYGVYLTSDRAPEGAGSPGHGISSRLLSQASSFGAWGAVRSRANPRDLFRVYSPFRHRPLRASAEKEPTALCRHLLSLLENAMKTASSQKAFALVSTLAILVMVVILITAFVTTMRTERQASHNYSEHKQAQALAQGCSTVSSRKTLRRS